MQDATTFEMGYQFTLLSEGPVAVRTGTSPSHVLLFMLSEVALSVVGLWALITSVLLGCLLMCQGMDLQGMCITSNKLTFATFKPAVFHMLTPDMSAEILGGATHLVANSASFISWSDPTQDCWSTTIPVLFARINIKCGHQLAQMVMLLQEILLHPLWKSGDFYTWLAGLWSAWPRWHLKVGPSPATHPPITHLHHLACHCCRPGSSCLRLKPRLDSRGATHMSDVSLIILYIIFLDCKHTTRKDTMVNDHDAK